MNAQAAAVMIEFICREIVKRPDLVIDADTPLVSSGLVDSLSLVDVLVKLEETTKRRIPSSRLRPEDLDSVRAMLEVAARLGVERRGDAKV